MAKEKGSGSKGKGGINLDEVVASNKKVLEQLNEISNQSAGFFNVAREAALKFIDTAEEVTNVLSEQCEKVKCFEVMSKSLEEAAASSKKFSNAISQQALNTKKFAEAAGFKKSGTGYANKHNVIEEISESSKRAKVGIIGLSGALKLLGSGFSLIKGIVSGLFSVIGKLFGLITSAVKGIFNFVNGLYETMFDMANDYVQLLQQLDRERENIRESFGDTSRGVGKAVVDMGNQLWSAGAAGLSGMQLFESAVEAMQAGHEIAKAGGAAYEKIVDQFSGKGINNVYGFAKGLGITNEEVGKMMGISVTTGRTLEGMFTEVEKFARGMNNTFGKTGGSFKSVSRDIIKARLDVKHFANVAIKDLAVAAQSARSLGVELDKITGIMDAFDNFDTAAENVSKLSQAFGVNLDTMQLMKANTPTEQLDILKKSFAAAGKSIQDLDKRSLNYLATTLHLDAAVLQQAGSSKNQGVAMDDLKAKSASIEQQMVSTTDALKDVMKDIKLYIRDLTNSTKGFFATFMEGFTEGIVQSGHFQKTMMTMADAIRHVKMAGREAGKAFVEYFPGVKDMLNGIVQIMPKIGLLFEKYSRSIGQFFKDLQNGISVGSLFGKLKEDTKQFFQDAGPGGSLFATGARNFLSTVGRIFQEAVAYLITSMTDMLEAALTKFANWLSEEPKSAMIKGGEPKPGSVLDFGGAILKSIEKSPIGQAFEDMGNRLGPPMEKIINLLGEKIKKYFQLHKKEIAEGIAGVLILALGPMLLKGVLGFLFKKGVSSLVERQATKQVAANLAEKGAVNLAEKGGQYVMESSVRETGEKIVAPAIEKTAAQKYAEYMARGGAKQVMKPTTLMSEGMAAASELNAGVSIMIEKQAAESAAKTVESVATKEMPAIAERVGGKGFFSKLGDLTRRGFSKLSDKFGSSLSKEIASGATKSAVEGATENVLIHGMESAAESTLLKTATKALGSKLLSPAALNIGSLAVGVGGAIGASMLYEAGHVKSGALVEGVSTLVSNAMVAASVTGPAAPIAVAASVVVSAAQLALSENFRKAFTGLETEAYTQEELNAAAEVKIEMLETAEQQATSQMKIFYAKTTEERTQAILDSQKNLLDVLKKMGSGEGGASTKFNELNSMWAISDANIEAAVKEFEPKFTALLASKDKYSIEQVAQMRAEQFNRALESNKKQGEEYTSEQMQELLQGNLPELERALEGAQAEFAKAVGLGRTDDASEAEIKINELKNDQFELRKKLFSHDPEETAAARQILNKYTVDNDKINIAYQALAASMLTGGKDINAALKKVTDEKDKKDKEAKATAEKKTRAQDTERMLGGIGFGAETTKMDIAGLENRLKEINQLNTKVMGTGPMSAKGIETTIKEMRDALSGINWTIIEDSKVEGVSKSLDAMRMLRGTLFLMEGLGDSAIRAANALRTFGKTNEKGTAAYILFNSADNLSNVVTKIGSAFTGIATITADWKTNFLSMTLEDVRNQVKDLAADAMAISQSINNYSTAILVANTDQMHQASKMLVSNLEDFHQSVQNVLDESSAKIKVSVDPLDPSSGTGTYFIHTTPLNVNIQVDVKMEAGNLEQMIISGNSAIVAGFQKVAALGPKAATVSKIGKVLDVNPS